MVSAHCWLQPYSAKTAGPSGGHLVRYFKREGEFDPVHYVQRTSEKTKDYADYVCGDVQNLPAWAGEKDAGKFFTAARDHEGGNRYYAFQIEFSLPRELNHEQHLAIREDLMAAVMPDLPALWVIHNKQLASGEMHPHCHILFSARKMDGIDRDEAQMFKRWQRGSPTRGGAEKDLFFSKHHAPEQLRQAMADITNFHLELAHAEERLDIRSLKRQGSTRLAIRYEHEERPDEVTRAREQAQAAASWEQRKVYKDIGKVEDISREEFVLLVRQWTRDYPQGKALERSTPEVVQAWSAKEAGRLREEQVHLEAALADVTLATHRVHGRIMVAEGGYARRQQEPTAEDLDKVWEHPLLGNRRSMIYHLPVSHKNYDDITPANQEMFWTERAAQDAGYRRAANEHYGPGTGQVREDDGRPARDPLQERAGPGGARPPRRGASRQVSQVAPVTGRGAASRSPLAPWMDDDEQGGLQAPDLDRKKGRDGYEW